MPVPVLAALFTLGVYLGNPNGSDPNAEQAFEQSYASFVSTMGVAPTYVSSYVDSSRPIVAWVGNEQWQAWSNAQSPIAKSMIPVLSLQMSSTDANAGTPQHQFRDFANGKNDYIMSQIVDVWAQYGFNKLVVRLGVEMNVRTPGYAGDSAASQAMWVRAFQHVSGVLRREAKAHNMSLQVMWNPDTTGYTGPEATANLYPGDQYVDMIGADMYADMYPFNDSFNPDTIHDWDTGAEDYSFDQWVADPINRAHYWSYPAGMFNLSNGTPCLDCSGGHSQSLDSLIAFALLHHKPFAVPEAGAGHSNGGVDVNDDGNFPLWLAQELTTAQANGLKVAFVTVWDSNGGGNYEFSYPSDGKPEEAASWAKYLGAQPRVTSTNSVPAVSVGTGPDGIELWVAEDAWQGDAQYTVSVDGQQVGNTMTAAASYAAGQRQVVTLRGNWGAGPHTLSVDYLNDANAGTSETDRNLYVDHVAYDGKRSGPNALYLLSGGIQSLTVGAKP